MNKLTFTGHAIARMSERGITEDQVIDALVFGKRSSTLKPSRNGTLARTYEHGNIIVVATDDGLIITVANPLFVIPMRMGKSLQMADIMKTAHQMHPPVRFLSVTTESTLLEQNEQELRDYWPFLSTSF